MNIRVPSLIEFLREPGNTVCIAVLVAGALIAYWPATAALWGYWVGDPYLGGHGILVAALGAWLLLDGRERIDHMATPPAPWALFLLVPSCIASLVFWRAGIQALHLLMLPALIWLAVLAAFGKHVARAVTVPIGFIYFGMPAWNLLSVPLAKLTLYAMTWLAPLAGLPATVSGNVVSFANGARFEVTLACSGVGFLAQGLAVATLLGEIEHAALSQRLRLLASMVVVALVTNWVRVLLLLLIGYHRGMDNVIVARHHLTFGYLLFVAVLLLFVWIATRSKAEPSVVAARTSAVSYPRLRASYIAAAVGLLAPPVLVALQASSPSTHEIALELPAGRANWHGPLEVTDLTWHPVFVGKHTESRAAYQNAGGQSVEALIIGYPVQEQGQELVNEDNSLLGDNGLSWLSTEVLNVGTNSYRELVVVDAQGQRSVIWSFYNIGGRRFVVPLLSQLWYGVTALGTSEYSALIAFRADCVPSCAEARTALTSFSQGMGQELLTARKIAAATGSEVTMDASQS